MKSAGEIVDILDAYDLMEVGAAPLPSSRPLTLTTRTPCSRSPAQADREPDARRPPSRAHLPADLAQLTQPVRDPEDHPWLLRLSPSRSPSLRRRTPCSRCSLIPLATRRSTARAGCASRSTASCAARVSGRTGAARGRVGSGGGVASGCHEVPVLDCGCGPYAWRDDTAAVAARSVGIGLRGDGWRLRSGTRTR